MNRASSMLLLFSLAASAAALDVVPEGKLMQRLHVPRSQEGEIYPEHEDVVLPLPDPEEGLAFVQDAVVPPNGYANVLGPKRQYCREEENSLLYDGDSGNESDCAARCDATADCQFMSFWIDGESVNRCRLTTTCPRFRHWPEYEVMIFEKTPRALTMPAGYSLVNVSRNYCGDRSYYNAGSTSVEDCASKCNNLVTCQYFSYWRTDTYHRCRITLFCESFRQNDQSIAIFMKPPPVAPPAPTGYSLSRGPGRDYCGDGSSYNGASEGFDDCKAKCDDKIQCQYFSYWETHSQKWCRLTLFCNRLRQQWERIVIYAKPEPVPPPVPAGMDMTLSSGPGRDYCGDHSTYNGKSDGFEDCAAKCNANKNCGYFSYWQTHSDRWCRITLFCNSLRQQDHTIFIYKKPPPVQPAAPAGYELFHNTSQNHCDDQVWRWWGSSGGVEDCAAKCTNRYECEYFSFWMTGTNNWCHLTGSCVNMSQQSHYIAIYDKLPPAAPPAPGHYTLIHGPSREYCDEHARWHTSEGLEDCAAKCDARVDCQYFSFWLTGGRNECRLTLFCRKYRQTNHHILVYAKPAPEAPEPIASYSLFKGPGRDYCGNSRTWEGGSAGYEDCAAKCTERGVDCQYMSFWRTGSSNYCKLTRYCDDLRQTDHSIVIYEKPPVQTPAAPMDYETTHNVSKNYCSEGRLWNGHVTDVEDCARRCSNSFACEFFSFWVSGKSGDKYWCRLTSHCNVTDQQDHYIAIYDKLPPAAPGAPEGYSLTRGPSRDRCTGRSIWWGWTTQGLDDCAAKCDERQACVYMSFWMTGGRNTCALYTTCDAYSQESHHIVIYKKQSPAAPDGYEVIGGIGNQYCSSVSATFRGDANDLGDCAVKCDGRPDCHYFDFWLAGSSTNCVLYGSCETYSQQNNPIVVLKKFLPELSTSPEGYTLVEDEGDRFCGKVRNNIWQGYAERERCAETCGEQPTCKYMTHSQNHAWCILSRDCDLKLKATVDMGYRIYEKAD